MKYIKSFLESVSNEYYSAGIVFHYNNKVLLVHPTDRNAPDEPIDYDIPEWSYPKGKVDAGENHREGAIREVSEELSINLPSDFLDDTEEQEAYVGMKNDPLPEYRGKKHYMYFTYVLNDEEFVEYFDSQYEIPREKLELWEVDCAKFFEMGEAKRILAQKIMKILE